MIEVESKKQTNPRAYRTNLINKLFESNGKGGYQMTATKPEFEVYREAWHRKYGRDERKGTPRQVFLWQVFHGQKDALENAISEGHVQVWDQDGTEFCGFRQTVAGVEKASQEMQKLYAGKVHLEKDEFSTMRKAFSNMSWEFGLENKQLEEASSSVVNQKSIEQAGLTKAMEEMLSEAKQAQERLLTTCLKLLGKCTDESDKRAFKGTVMEIKDWVNKNDTVLTWKDCCSCCCS